MLNFILPILKNPLTRMIGQKVIGGIQHKMEKDKIIKAKEIEAIKTVNVEQVRASTTSWKDEYLVVIFGSFRSKFRTTLTRLYGKRLGYS